MELVSAYYQILFSPFQAQILIPVTLRTEIHEPKKQSVIQRVRLEPWSHSESFIIEKSSYIPDLEFVLSYDISVFTIQFT